MAEPIEKIQKLIALALHNPNVQEAQCAALKALQLMQTHGIKLIAPPVERPAPPQYVPFTPPPPPPTPPYGYQDPYADLRHFSDQFFGRGPKR